MEAHLSFEILIFVTVAVFTVWILNTFLKIQALKKTSQNHYSYLKEQLDMAAEKNKLINQKIKLADNLNMALNDRIPKIIQSLISFQKLIFEERS